MLRVFLQLLLCLSMVVSLAQPQEAFAQSVDTGNLEAPMGPKQQLATIIFAGLAGAILGLSTLSFYGRPQEKLANIAVGFAVGIIVGTSYTTYKAATLPRYYGLLDEKLIDQELELRDLAFSESRLLPNSTVFTPRLAWSWEF